MRHDYAIRDVMLAAARFFASTFTSFDYFRFSRFLAYLFRLSLLRAGAGTYGLTDGTWRG